MNVNSCTGNSKQQKMTFWNNSGGISLSGKYVGRWK